MMVRTLLPQAGSLHFDSRKVRTSGGRGLAPAETFAFLRLLRHLRGGTMPATVNKARGKLLHREEDGKATIVPTLCLAQVYYIL